MLADLAPTPLAMAVQVSCSLVTTVLSGVVIASQEFRLQSLVYFSGLVLVFTPIVLIVADDPEIEMSIAWLLWANAAYQCWLCAGQVIPPAPSSLLQRHQAPEAQPSHRPANSGCLQRMAGVHRRRLRPAQAQAAAPGAWGGRQCSC